MVILDHVRHVYIDLETGALVPSVSSILRHARVREAPYMPPAADGVGESRQASAMARGLKRGTEVHRLTRSLDETGDLEDAFEDYFDPAQLLPETVNYVSAYSRFLDEGKYTPTAWEVVVHHPSLKYAGRCDGVGWLGPRRIMIDRKTDQSLHPAVWLQLAFYRLAWNTAHPQDQIDATYAVKLCNDMTYRLVENPLEPGDIPFVYAAVMMANWHRMYSR